MIKGISTLKEMLKHVTKKQNIKNTKKKKFFFGGSVNYSFRFSRGGGGFFETNLREKRGMSV